MNPNEHSINKVKMNSSKKISNTNLNLINEKNFIKISPTKIRPRTRLSRNILEKTMNNDHQQLLEKIALIQRPNNREEIASEKKSSENIRKIYIKKTEYKREPISRRVTMEDKIKEIIGNIEKYQY